MRRQIALTFLTIFALFSMLSLSSVSAASANISKSFHSNQSIPNGSLVSLVSDSDNVQLANMSNSQNLAGVSLASNQSLLAVNPGSNSVQVATSGQVNLLVSSVNGYISTGDEISASPFNGIGMKSDEGDKIIGTAITNFNSSTDGATREMVRDDKGGNRSILVGYVKINISIGTENKNVSDSFIQSLQNFVEGLTGKPITVARLLIGLSVTFIALVTIVTLTYAAIYGGIVSIGRNPLAKFSIFKTMTSVLSMVLIIALITILIVYLILF